MCERDRIQRGGQVTQRTRNTMMTTSQINYLVIINPSGNDDDDDEGEAQLIQ